MDRVATLVVTLTLALAGVNGQSCVLYNDNGVVLETASKSCVDCQVTALERLDVSAATLVEGGSPVAFESLPVYQCPEVSDPSGPALCVVETTDGRIQEVSVRSCSDCVSRCLASPGSCGGIVWSGQDVPQDTLPSFTCPANDIQQPTPDFEIPPPTDENTTPPSTDCPAACPYIYLPVCLANNKTIDNGCLAQCEDSPIQCQGDCPCTDPSTPPTDPVAPPQPDPQDPPVTDPVVPPQPDTGCAAIICPTIYAPVCLSNNQTADNDCVAACQPFPILCRGMCPCASDGTDTGTMGIVPAGGDISNTSTAATPAPTPDATVDQPVVPDGQAPAPAPVPAGVQRAPECDLPIVIGPCRASFPRFAFDAETGQCKQFLYGGCQGNANNYEAVEDCQAACLGITPRWLCQAPCEPTLSQCQEVACPTQDCGAFNGFYEEAEPIVLDVDSWAYHGGPNHPKKVYNAAQCCDTCKQTPGCNNWAFCSDPAGCGYGCVKATDPSMTDAANLVGQFGQCNSDESFTVGTCRLSFLASNATMEVVTDERWTSGMVQVTPDLSASGV